MSLLCPSCGESISECMWVQSCEFIHDCAEELKFIDESNGTKRKLLYRQYILHTEGYLGRGVRVNPPECVKRGIRALFPDPHGSYMGFRDN